MLQSIAIGVIFLTGILPLFLLFFKKKAFNKEPIVPFLWLTAIATLYELIGTVALKINTTYWFQLYSLLCFCTLYYFFFRLLDGQRKKLLVFFLIGFISVYIVSTYLFDNNTFISTAINEPFTVLFVLIFSFLWFKRIFEKVNIPNLWHDANFYFVAGFLIYHSSTFLFFLLGDFLLHIDSYFYPWLLNLIATVILRIFLILGTWKMKRD